MNSKKALTQYKNTQYKNFVSTISALTICPNTHC